MGEFVHIRLDEAFELEQDARAALGVGTGPDRKRSLRRIDCCGKFGLRRKRNPGLNLASAGIINVPDPARLAGDSLAIDEMMDVSHDFPPHNVRQSKIQTDADTGKDSQLTAAFLQFKQLQCSGVI
jgi:hypothetical protein